MPHLSFIIRYLLRPCYILDSPDLRLDRMSIDGVSCVFIGSGTDRLSGVLNDYSGQTIPTEAFQSPMIVGVTEKVLVYDEADRSGGSLDFTLDTQDCHPGYTKLIPTTPNSWKRHGVRWSDTGVPWLKHCQMDVPSSLGKLIRTATGYKCDGFPADAMEWVTRDRSIAWPPPSLIEAVLRCSCIVVSTAHANSLLKDVEWQFVFNEAEQCLITSLSQPQRYCFRVFKILVDTFTNSLAIKLKTVHLKSVLFYACEEISGTTWADNCAGCIMFLLSKLESHVSERCLPNYFICGNNMVDHYSGEALGAIARRLSAVRLFPIPTVVFLAESHGINQTNMLQPVIEDISTFKRDKDFHRTVKEAFVPGIVILAKAYLGSDNTMVGTMFQMAFNEIQFSREDNSSRGVNTSPAFKKFVLEELNKETIVTRYALAKVLDEQFNMDTCSTVRQSHDVVSVKDIIGPNYTGPVADVPINKGILHCTLSQMKLLDDLAFELFMSGNFTAAATLLEFGIAKSDTAKSETIDVGDIDDPDLKADVLRRNNRKTESVNKQCNVMVTHMMSCRSASGKSGYK